MMKEILIQALTQAIFLAARRLAGPLLPQIVELIQDAQQQFGPGTGTDKKKWALEQLRLVPGFLGSNLWSLYPVVLSAVFDAIVAWVKTQGK